MSYIDGEHRADLPAGPQRICTDLHTKENTMSSWHLAPALVQLRAEVNALWPNRSKASDGTIGDADHSSRTSDHNPNSRRRVNAIDITAKGIDTAKLINAAKKHPSVRYIIHNRKIMNRDIGNFQPRPYRRSNPHTTHVHISLYQSKAAEDRTQSWGLSSAKGGGSTGGRGNTHREIKAGDLIKLYTKGKTVEEWQRRALGYTGKKADGYFGPGSEADTKAWQRANGFTGAWVDGMVGEKSWAKLNAKPAPKPKGSPYPLAAGHSYGPEHKSPKRHSGYWEKDRPAVKRIQKKVGARETGRYDTATYNKVKAYQRKHRIGVDGGVGPQTWRHMFG